MSESEIFLSLFSLTALSMKTRVNAGLGVRELGGGKDISCQHSDLMDTMCSMIWEAETQPAEGVAIPEETAVLRL